MKKLMIAIIFAVFLCVVSQPALSCSKYMDSLVGQCFEVTVDETDFILCFGEPIFGPCPTGVVTLEYIDVQHINEIPYESLISFDFTYYTNPDVVTIADVLDFVLVDGRLILLPEEPLIFKLIED